MAHSSKLLMALVVLAGIITASEAAPRGTIIPENARQLTENHHKNQRFYERLETGLNRVLESDSSLEEARSRGYRVLNGRIQVTIVSEESRIADLEAWLIDNDAALVSSAWNLVQAHVPPELLPRLNHNADVSYVRRPFYAPKPEPVTSKTGGINDTTEGLAALNATTWHNAGIRGQGIKVGIIDAEFGRLNELLGSELPSSVQFNDYTGQGIPTDPTSVHGTACAEVIYDIVPSVEGMYLAQVGTQIDINNATTWMRNNGVDVISMSLGWLSWGAGDGTGYLPTVINGFTNAGGIWVNSAGNSALAHWQGYFSDPDNDTYHDFQTGFEINYVTSDGTNNVWIPSGTQVNAALVYNQWNGISTDVDFCLYHWDGANTPTQVICADSDNNQTGVPIEDLSYETTTAGYYGFVIVVYSGSTQNLQIEFFNRFDSSPLMFNVKDGSLTPPSDANGAIAAAALDVRTYNLENYSSRGPTNGPGGNFSGGTIKPDIASFANVSTTVYGANQFSGTSSACPHIAGAAALVASGYPTYTNSQVRTYLENNSVELGASGKDNIYGHGRLVLGTPPNGGGGGGGGGGEGPCVEDLSNGVICLRSGRFEMTMTWTGFDHVTQPVVFKHDSDQTAIGVFQNNLNDVTLITKVTNGCSFNGNYWVWLGAFTRAGLNLTVRDTVTNRSSSYSKNLSVLMTTIQDDASFPCTK